MLLGAGNAPVRHWPARRRSGGAGPSANSRPGLGRAGGLGGGGPRNLELKLLVVGGERGPSLVGVADSSDDLLVVGAGRRGVMSRMWRGKVSRYCVSHARCPVLAVPQPATAREMGLGPSVWPLRHRALSLDRALREWDAA